MNPNPIVDVQPPDEGAPDDYVTFRVWAAAARARATTVVDHPGRYCVPVKGEPFLLHALELKEEGNRLVRTGQHKLAVDVYDRALDALQMPWLRSNGKVHPLLAYSHQKLEVSLLFNLALCCDTMTSIQLCTWALERDPRHAKALYRRAWRSFFSIRCLHDLRRAAKVCPRDTKVRSALEKAERGQRGRYTGPASLQDLRGEDAPPIFTSNLRVPLCSCQDNFRRDPCLLCEFNTVGGRLGLTKTETKRAQVALTEL